MAAPARKLAHITPYDLVPTLLRLRGEPMDVASYPYLRAIYNTKHDNLLLGTSRQIAKSTTLSSKLVIHAVAYPRSVSMYVAPLQDQAEVFSLQRLKDFLIDSPAIREGFFTGPNVVDQVFRKQLNNLSMIALGYGQRTADRLRGRSIVGGQSADGKESSALLVFDEYQDIFSEVVPIIKETAFRVNNPVYWHTGTPKSLSNHMEAMREKSTDAQWAVRCQQMGCKKWNLNWTEKNIGDTGVICEFCGKPINTNLGQWVVKRPLDRVVGKDARITVEAYRVSQLMVKPIMDLPSKWRELLGKVRDYSTAQLYNEVFGLPYDSGTQPVSLTQLMACCDPNLSNRPPEPDASLPPLVMGVDWAFIGQDSYTVVTIGAWDPFPEKFRVYYWKIYKGSETDPDFQEHDIIRLFKQYNCRIIGADWGAGHVQNIHLINALGEERVAQMWHTGLNAAGRKTVRAKWEPKTRKWHLARTSVMTDTFESVRRKQMVFPRAEECGEFFDHFLAVALEYDERTNLSKYVHVKPDDCVHSTTFAMLAGELMLLGDFRGHSGTTAVIPTGGNAKDREDDGGPDDSYYN